jgi:hypothetical protein
MSASAAVALWKPYARRLSSGPSRCRIKNRQVDLEVEQIGGLKVHLLSQIRLDLKQQSITR